MGRFEKRPENPRSNGDPFGAAETALKAVTEELQIIQRNLLKSLQDDVKHLQTEKVRLAEEIKSLQENKENLQNRRQITELQELVRQLAQLLANHISTQLQSTLSSLTASSGGEPYVPVEINADTQQLLGSLDNALSVTFNSLQDELSNYQSNFSQQLSRMSLQQQQAEAIMAELVNRLTSELEKTTVSPTLPPPLPPPPPPLEWSPVGVEGEIYFEETSSGEEVKAEIISEPEVTISNSINEAPTLISPPPRIPREPIPEPISVLVPEQDSRPPEPLPSFTPPLPPTESSLIAQISSLWQRPTGLLLIVLSTVVSAISNVALKAIFLSRSQILGVFEVERLISPTLGNSLLILMLRMLVVVPLMLVLAPIFHPPVWQDLQKLIDSLRGNSSVAKTSTKRVLFLSVVSGGFLFLSQVLIYLAIGQVQAGIAIALLFVYPVISGLLSSFLFRDRLNSFHIGAIACILFGEFLVLGGSTNTGTGNVTLGTTTGIASGVAFALYVILTRICAAKLHPVSFTLINFATMLLLCFFALMLPYPSTWSLQVDLNQLLDLVLSAFILGVLTLVGYFLNIVGIGKFGATRSALVGATVPTLTVIIAGLIIQETLPLDIVLGVLLVTGGAAGFSFEKMRSITKANKTTN